MNRFIHSFNPIPYDARCISHLSFSRYIEKFPGDWNCNRPIFFIIYMQRIPTSRSIRFEAHKSGQANAYTLNGGHEQKINTTTALTQKSSSEKLILIYKPVSGINPGSFLVDMIDIINLSIEICCHVPSIWKINIVRWYIWHYNIWREIYFVSTAIILISPKSTIQCNDFAYLFCATCPFHTLSLKLNEILFFPLICIKTAFRAIQCKN